MKQIPIPFRQVILKELGTTTKNRDVVDSFKILYKVYSWTFPFLEETDYKNIPDFELNKHEFKMNEFFYAISDLDILTKQIKEINKNNKLVINNSILNEIRKKEAIVFGTSKEMVKVIGYILVNSPDLRDREISREDLKDVFAKAGQLGYFKQDDISK